MGLNRRKKLLSWPFVLLMLINLFVAMGFSMITTLISAYAIDLGASLAIGGTLGGVFSLTALLVRPFGGLITDLKSRKMLCVISTLLISVIIFGYAFTSSDVSLFVFRIMHGAVFAISGTANIALVSEYVPRDKLAEGIGYFGLGQVMSQVSGPALGVFIRNAYGYQTLFIIISATTLIAAIMSLFLPYRFDPSSKTRPSTLRKLVSSLIARESLAYALVGGVFSLCNGIINAFLIIIGDDRKIVNITVFFTINALILFVIRLFIGKIIDKNSLSLIVNIALVASAAAMIIIGRAHILPLIVLAALLKAIGQGGGQISLQTACIKKVDASKVGIATSTYYIGADIGQGVGPIIGGKIASVFGYQTMFTFVAVVIIAALIFFNYYQHKEKVSKRSLKKPKNAFWDSETLN